MHDVAATEKNARWFFNGPSGKTPEEIWHWWQQRRFRYNRDVFFVGLVTLVLVLVAGSAAVKEGEDFEEPIMMIFGPIIYAVLANIAYTAGPIYDVTFYREGPRKKLLKAGYVFSLILTGLPGSGPLWLGS